jgi:hypothetical protein
MVVRVRSLVVPLAVLSVLALLMLAGCGAEQPTVASVWPIATSEATVSAPGSVLTWPLTGLPLPEDARVATIPVCVKVHDSGAKKLTGVASADIVYETRDQGSGTQLACLFGRKVPARIGPLSAAGMPDLWVVPQYRAMLFSAGATSTLAASMARWSEGSDASLGKGPQFDSAYKRGGGEGYVLGSAAEDLAARLASTVTSGTAARLRFSASNLATPSPIVSVSVPFSAGYDVSWKWKSSVGAYERSVRGKAALDAAGGRRISAKNVVVMWARYSALDADIAGDAGYDVTLGGSGQASVFRDGVRYDGKWKADGESPPRFIAEDGSAIRLAPGNTWFEVIPLSANITMK